VGIAQMAAADGAHHRTMPGQQVRERHFRTIADEALDQFPVRRSPARQPPRQFRQVVHDVVRWVVPATHHRDPKSWKGTTPPLDMPHQKPRRTHFFRRCDNLVAMK
jgi:hypothetical protein